MNIRTILAGTVVFLGFAGMSSGCSSAKSTCALICDCEHCGDPKEDFTCLQYETEEAEALAYECGDAWETYMSCVQDQGTCNEKQANFTTRINGTCNNSACSTSGETCETNDDCIGTGDDLCDGEEAAVRDCVQAASGGVSPSPF